MQIVRGCLFFCGSQKGYVGFIHLDVCDAYSGVLVRRVRHVDVPAAADGDGASRIDDGAAAAAAAPPAGGGDARRTDDWADWARLLPLL